MSTSGNSAATRKLTLRSSDEKEFEVPVAVARQSHLIGRMIQDGYANNVIPLYNVTSTILEKVIEYCSKHADAIPDDPTSKERLRNYDAKFVKIDQATLFDIIKAAHYMEIKSLIKLTCQTVTDMINGKTPEEIRQTFDICNNYTPEEEEEFRRDRWAFEYQKRHRGGGPSA